MATPSPKATKINERPKFSAFSENAPIAAGAAEVYAYGTAVKVEDVQPKTQG